MGKWGEGVFQCLLTYLLMRTLPNVCMCLGQRERSFERDPAGGATGLLRRATGSESSDPETRGQNEGEASAVSHHQREGVGGEEKSRGEGCEGDPPAHTGGPHFKVSQCSESSFNLNNTCLSSLRLIFKEVQALQKEKDSLSNEREELSVCLLEQEKTQEGSVTLQSALRHR